MTSFSARVFFVVLAAACLIGCKSSSPKPTSNNGVAPASAPAPVSTAVAAAPAPTAAPTVPVWLTWDLSQSIDAGAIGTPDSKQAMYPGDLDDDTQLWFWKGEGRIVIKLPRGRTIDSHANSLTATVKNSRVVGANFNTVGPPMDAATLRQVMVRNINELRLRKGADADDAIRVLDKWIARAVSVPYEPSENFGSRDGEPNLDVRLGKSAIGNDFHLGYELFWFQ